MCTYIYIQQLYALLDVRIAMTPGQRLEIRGFTYLYEKDD